MRSIWLVLDGWTGWHSPKPKVEAHDDVDRHGNVFTTRYNELASSWVANELKDEVLAAQCSPRDACSTSTCGKHSTTQKAVVSMLNVWLHNRCTFKRGSLRCEFSHPDVQAPKKGPALTNNQLTIRQNKYSTQNMKICSVSTSQIASAGRVYWIYLQGAPGLHNIPQDCMECII